MGSIDNIVGSCVDTTRIFNGEKCCKPIQAGDVLLPILIDSFIHIPNIILHNTIVPSKFMHFGIESDTFTVLPV